MMALNTKTNEEAKEVIVVENTLCDADVLNREVRMEDKLKLATDIADHLKDILKKQGLTVSLNKQDQDATYVTAEGWNTLGTILGTYARTEIVEPVDFTKAKIAYRARVSIMQGENCLATAEAIADSNGFQKQEHQIYSMAQTRAMGKAYRMAFSWIIKLAGYEPTPAEEMISEEKQKRKAEAKAKNSFTPEQRKKLEKNKDKKKDTQSAIEVEAKDVEVVK